MLVFLAIIAIILLTLYVIQYIQKKCVNFVIQNSIALKKLTEINNRYVFYPYKNFNQTHTYDNETFYNNISCADYLIYQLQYLSTQITDQATKVDRNRQKYQLYVDEVKSIQLEQFQSPTGKLNLNYLCNIEKKLFSKSVQSPATQFYVTVTLYCSTMNGRIYHSKMQNFSVEEISSFINRLKNKNRTFYNDRNIWNSLCRVERGKVSNKMRFAIYERDGYRCRYCGVSERYTALEIDHIIPIAKGGKSTYENLQTLCSKCNYQKGDRIYY